MFSDYTHTTNFLIFSTGLQICFLVSLAVHFKAVHMSNKKSYLYKVIVRVLFGSIDNGLFYQPWRIETLKSFNAHCRPSKFPLLLESFPPTHPQGYLPHHPPPPLLPHPTLHHLHQQHHYHLHRPQQNHLLLRLQRTV